MTPRQAGGREHHERPPTPATTPQRARPYRSPLREQQAARTRQRITDSARELFLEKGFAGTTIAAIARGAGVSQQTVYAVFGSKSAVLETLLSGLEEAAGAVEWLEALSAEDDPAELLDLFARWTASMLGTSRELLVAARGSLHDPRVRELAARGDEHRRDALRALVGRIAAAGALRPDLRPERAVDRAWALTGAELYLAVSEGCAWSRDDYAAWVSELLRQQLLKH